jgi:adenylate cyclase
MEPARVEPNEHRRLAAIMFTDMAGYSALTQRNEALALELLDEHQKILRAIFPAFQGREIETAGDSFFVEFESALGATQCAIEIQRTLHERNRSLQPDRKIQIRIGIHLGDVVSIENHVHGDGVNIAARIEPLAEPGGICVSEDVARQIQNKIDLRLSSLGQGELKNIVMPVVIHRIVMPWERKQAAILDRLTSEFKSRSGKIRLLSFALSVMLLLVFVLIALNQKSTQVAVAGDRNSIAVLPFKNLNADKENEFFSDGMTEDIITQLSKIGRFRVISRTSVMQYKAIEKPVREIGKELRAACILEGAVRRSGNQVRISARLIDVKSDVNLWADSYDNQLTEIFAIQSDVARKIAQALETRLSPDEQERIQKKPTNNLDAYDLYLKARYYWNERTGEGTAKAITYFQRAIAMDSLFALAYSGLADAYGSIGYYNYSPPGKAFPEAKAAAVKALQLDSTLCEAHATLGSIYSDYDWNWAAAEREFKRSIELNPSYASAHQWYAVNLIVTGRTAESLNEINRAVEIDPLSPIIRTDVGEKLYYARQYDSAIAQCKQTLEMYPNFFPAHFFLGLAQLQKSMYPEAIATLTTAVANSGSHPGIMATLGYAEARSGNEAEARKILSDLKARSEKEYISPYLIAVVYAGLGDKDRTFEWLEKAYADRSNWMVFLNVQPLFDSIRSDRRFAALLRKVGFEAL